jgi:hypothetical protein
MEMLLPIVVALLAALGPALGAGETKTTIGAVEEALLLPWGVTLPARVDTGAARSSLDARDVRVDGGEVTFLLPEQYGGLSLRLPLYEMATFRTPEGEAVRPVVSVELCLGARRIRALVSLNDRRYMVYPLLLGRSFLADGFLVDVSRSHVLKPACEGVRGRP